MDLAFPKHKQTAYRTKRKNPKVKISEDAIQKQCNDMLVALRIKYFRVPNYVWLWMKHNAPIEILKALTDSFKDMPDNVCLIKITDKYALCMPLELKTESGKLNKRQGDWIKYNGGVVSRSPDESIKLVDQFIKDAEKIKEIAKEKGIEL